MAKISQKCSGFGLTNALSSAMAFCRISHFLTRRISSLRLRLTPTKRGRLLLLSPYLAFMLVSGLAMLVLCVRSISAESFRTPVHEWF